MTKTSRGIEPLLAVARYGTTNEAVMDKMKHDNIRTWLEHEAIKLGTDRQREFYARGVLPEDELLQIVRAELFKVFGRFDRWSLSHDKPKLVREIRHVVTCDPSDRDYEHFVEDDPIDTRRQMSPAEEINFGALVAAAAAPRVHPWLVRTGGTVKVEPVTHWFACTACEGETARSSAKVTITWGERELVREYAL